MRNLKFRNFIIGLKELNGLQILVLNCKYVSIRVISIV